jgi:hypothetical protein
MTRRELLLPPTLVAELRQAGVVAHCVTDADPLAAQALNLAARAYCLPPDFVASPNDRYSHIYTLCRDANVVGTITVSMARDGLLEQEEFLPQGLLAAYRDIICEAYRLAVDSAERPFFSMARLLMRLSFADGLCSGMRLAVAGAKPTMLGYYRRIGYLPFAAPSFSHPRLCTEHLIVGCPADPTRATMFQDLCRSLPDPLTLASLQSYFQFGA